MTIALGRAALLVLSAVSVTALVYAVANLVNGRGPRDWALAVLLTAAAFPWQMLLGAVQGQIVGHAVRQLQMTPHPHAHASLPSLLVAWNRLFGLADWLPVFAACWLALRRHRAAAGADAAPDR